MNYVGDLEIINKEDTRRVMNVGANVHFTDCSLAGNIFGIIATRSRRTCLSSVMFELCSLPAQSLEPELEFVVIAAKECKLMNQQAVELDKSYCAIEPTDHFQPSASFEQPCVTPMRSNVPSLPFTHWRIFR
jgi:hypothetical protein